MRLMRITRARIDDARTAVREYLKTEEQRIVHLAIKHCRDKHISMNVDTVALDRITFFEVGDHYAETDGMEISLNRQKTYTESTLFYTLLHESLHYCIRRKSGSEVSEEREHKWMEDIDARTIHESV